jgi:hypothetical protein
LVGEQVSHKSDITPYHSRKGAQPALCVLKRFKNYPKQNGFRFTSLFVNESSQTVHSYSHFSRLRGWRSDPARLRVALNETRKSIKLAENKNKTPKEKRK